MTSFQGRDRWKPRKPQAQALRRLFRSMIAPLNRQCNLMEEYVQGLQRLRPSHFFFLVVLACMMAFGLSHHAKAQNPVQVGWVERVALYPGGFVLSAKVDTGAVTCSLHAPNTELYERDGIQRVRFSVKDAEGKDVTIDQPVIGTRRIKRHFGGHQERLVIKLGVCLGSLYRETEVNLVDRTGFEYPMLIGRSYMDKALVVNPSAKHTVEPVCPHAR